MNIFYLDQDPATCAAYHCDKHVVKMTFETAQMITTVASRYGLPHMINPTHANHPCVKWLCESADNLRYLLDLLPALNSEWQSRYGHTRNHKGFEAIFPSAEVIASPRDFFNTKNPDPQPLPVDQLLDLLPDVPMTPPPLAMPFESVVPNLDPFVQATLSYQNYYCTEKAHLLQYRNNNTPEWVKQNVL